MALWSLTLIHLLVFPPLYTFLKILVSGIPPLKFALYGSMEPAPGVEVPPTYALVALRPQFLEYPP